MREDNHPKTHICDACIEPRGSSRSCEVAPPLREMLIANETGRVSDATSAPEWWSFESCEMASSPRWSDDDDPQEIGRAPSALRAGVTLF